MPRTVSQALCAELKNISSRRREWWQEWRGEPTARQGKFHNAPDTIAGLNNYLWIRQNAEYNWFEYPEENASDGAAAGQGASVSVPIRRQLLDCEPVRAAIEIIRGQVNCQRLRQDNRSLSGLRRIGRLSVPRGGGSGTLYALFQHREIHEHLFPDPATEKVQDNAGNSAATEAGDGSNPRVTDTGARSLAGRSGRPYQGVFFASLSFSIEFSSVIEALSRFFAYQVALLETEQNCEAVELRFNKRRDGGDPGDETTVGDIDRAIAELEVTDFDKAVKAYAAARMEMPQLAYEEHRSKADQSELRADDSEEHRLDVLRKVMRRFGEVAKKSDKRLLVCLNGLDRICDPSGDGWNPMHRAFFRLLTDTGEEDSPNKVTQCPIDLLLVSNEPATPICYLSEEVKGRSPWETDLVRSSRTRRRLRRWPRLPVFASEDRAKIAPVKISGGVAKHFVSWARSSEGGPLKRKLPGPPDRYPMLRRLAENNLVVTVWLNTCAELLWMDLGSKEFAGNRKAIEEAQAAYLEELLEQADAEAATDGFSGVLEFVLGTYRRFDRRKLTSEDHVLRNERLKQCRRICDQANGCDDETRIRRAPWQFCARQRDSHPFVAVLPAGRAFRFVGLSESDACAARRRRDGGPSVRQHCGGALGPAQQNAGNARQVSR